MTSNNLNDQIKWHMKCRAIILEIGRKLIMIEDRYGVKLRK